MRIPPPPLHPFKQLPLGRSSAPLDMRSRHLCVLQAAGDAHHEQAAAHEATLQRHSVPGRLPSVDLRRLAREMRAEEHRDAGDSVAARSALSHSTGGRHFFGVHGAT